MRRGTEAGNGGATWLSGAVASKLITWVLQLAIFAGIYWLKDHFVSKEAYESDNKQALAATVQIAKDAQHVTDQLENTKALSVAVEQLKADVQELKIKVRESGTKR